MPKQYLAGRYAFKTDIGKVRLTNEDQACALTNGRGNILLLVCDGMGGERKGDYASSLAKTYISDAFLAKDRFINHLDAIIWAKRTVKQVNSKIYNESLSNHEYHGMGTTLSMVLIINNYALMIQIGDSRVYFLKNKELTQMSEDQTYVGYLYRTGQIKKEEMATHPKRHVLMNALGVYPSTNLDLKIFPYHKEQVLLCSDGLYNNVDETMIEAILLSDDSPEQKITKLISIGNANGGSDNMGIVIWEAK